MRRTLIFIATIFVVEFAGAQIGGVSTYDFLALSPSARVTALGGTNITLFDHDLSTQLSNPASLNPEMSQHAAFGTTIYPGKINFGNVSYAQQFKVPGTFGFGLQYIDYGKFQETDETANVIGSFTAEEMNFYAGYGHQFGKIFSAGINAKFIYSNLGFWNSEGMAADLAAMVNDTAHLITASIVAKNIGGQFKPYTNGSYTSIPFDLQAGFAFGFKHLPLRFHITLHHLYEWNIRYDNPADDLQNNLFGDSSALTKKYTIDNIFRHVIIGGEFNIKKVVRIDFAYNHLRQQELSLTTKRSIPGISVGLGLHIRQFDFTYGIQPMAQGGALNYFTLSVNTAGFVKRRTVNKDGNSQKL